MNGWDIFEIGYGIFSTGYKVFNDYNNIQDARAARNAGRAAGIEAANARARMTIEGANMQALLLQEQGMFHAAVGEFNAQIYEQQAEMAIQIAQREASIIGANSQIDQTLHHREFAQTQSQLYANVGASGIELEGSPVYVALDNAAAADYQLAIIKWVAQVAQQNAIFQGDLNAWAALVAASRERFMAQMMESLAFREAELVKDFANRAAQAEIDAAS